MTVSPSVTFVRCKPTDEDKNDDINNRDTNDVENVYETDESGDDKGAEE